MTDGEDNVSRSTARSIATKAAAAGVSIWSVGIVNEYMSGPTLSGRLIRTQPDRALKSLSKDSGGGVVILKNVADWGPAFARTAQALARPYVLRFSPAVVNGKTHKLEVRIKSAGHTVLAPTTYRATSELPR
jgi:hypothetical protein